MRLLRSSIAATASALAFTLGAAAQLPDFPNLIFSTQGIIAPPCYEVPKRVIGGPVTCSDSYLGEWKRQLQAFKADRLLRMGYDPTNYLAPEYAWTQSSFIQTQMMMEDRFFYDPVSKHYTVDRYLDDLKQRYGGIDSVLVWHTYTNLGIDDRNQYDFLRDMPGGIPAVKQMIADFHQRGVKVLFPVMIWDQGTRDEGLTNWDAMAKLMKEVGADGVNGDTMDGVPRAFAVSAAKLNSPLVLEPEKLPGHDEMLAYNLMEWGYWQFPYAPDVSRSKWLEPRTMVHISARWEKDHTNNLQAAFLNGVGFVAWENVWGIWQGITPRDGELIRRMATMERGLAPFLVSADWEPYYTTERRGVFASRWPVGSKTVFTVVNRNDAPVMTELLRVKNVAPGTHFYDVYKGQEIHPRLDQGDAMLPFAVEASGISAVLQTSQNLSVDEQKLLQVMSQMTQAPLASYSKEWHPLNQTMVESETTTAPKTPPIGMVLVPKGSFRFKVTGIEIEGHDDAGVDVQYPWESNAGRYHDHVMDVKSFYMDTHPVTNAEFKQFLDASRYTPADGTNFLRDWQNGTYPAGWGNRPVTWVSLLDARAYAAWSHKRLPHEWEWQYASQGTDQRQYPWGNTWRQDAVAPPDRGRRLSAPEAVGLHAAAASPFGVQDLVGNVWQMTDEFDDTHTRAVILRGGSYYQPQGSIWYFPQAYRNDEHGKFLLTGEGLDRSGAVGFRCVMDAN